MRVIRIAERLWFLALPMAALCYYLGYIQYQKKSYPLTAVYALACAGILVMLVAHLFRDRYMRMPLKKVDKLSGTSFENYLAVHFRKMGYHVKQTSATADYGADLILRKRKEKTVVQAKRYSKAVGVAAVQEVIGAREYYAADRAIVVTNWFFTKNAQILASQSGVELWDRKQLKKQFGARE